MSWIERNTMKAETAILQAIIASLWTRAQFLTVDGGGRWSSIYDSPLDPPPPTMTGCFLFWSLSGVSFLIYLSHREQRAQMFPFCCWRQSWSPEGSRTLHSAGEQKHWEHRDGYGCLLCRPLTKAYPFTQLKMINIPKASCDPPSPSASLEVSVASVLDGTWCKS